MKKEQFLLESVNVTGYKETKIQSDEIEAFYRQKPNRKFLKVFPFFVSWYNIYSDSFIILKKQERNLRYDKINAERIQKSNERNLKREKRGKPPKNPDLLSKEDDSWRESVRDIGEAPVIFDSSLTKQTAQQLNLFLFNKGYFNNKVTWKVDYQKKNSFGKIKPQRAHLTYEIVPNEPYKINKVSYVVEDKKLENLFYADTVNTLIKRGARYDSQVLQDERVRITKLMLNNGYYFFENAYVSFNVDSNYAGHFVSIELILKKFARNYSSTNDSVVYVSHTKYRINQIYVITEPVTGNLRDLFFKDTTLAKKHDCKFIHNGPLKYKPEVVSNFIKMRKNSVFIRDTAEITYKSLMNIGIFKSVTIQFFKSEEFPSKLDCYIICNPIIKQSITAETEGTNTFGNLGIDGSLIYQNRNLFKGGELIEIKMQGALTAQKQFNSGQVIDLQEPSKIQRLFNTFQFGPELKFSVPRAIFPFSLLPFKNEMDPHTFLKTSLNYQARPEFIRTITNFASGFNFRSRNKLIMHEVIPLEAYVVRATTFGSFKSDLTSFNDAFLLNSFIDHLTTLSKYSITRVSKENASSSRRAVSYVKLNLMSSGNILRWFFNTFGGTKDSLGRYTIMKIPFAHFLRADAEYRLYIPVRNKSRLVYRLAGGIGRPLTNLNVLPYEQSFFSGGPNSVRAWRARTLGPGAYDPRTSQTRFDKIGDLLIEGNVEYRFHMIKSFYGALFADAGNIWRLNKTEDKPDGEFRVDKFYNQFAVGGGFGIRWDLEFLIIRLDLAMPIKDPKYAEGNRFTLDKKPYKEIVANFGIGYPF